MYKDPFAEYIKQSEPGERYKSYAWHTAIGLQAVDGLKPSDYLIDKAIKNIEGEITIDNVQELLNSYYIENPGLDKDDRTEEADKVSVRIAKILSEEAFSFTPNEYISIHKKLFVGIYSHAGRIRDYNITKKEWILDGATVLYGSASELEATLEYDFSQEKKFSYRNLSMDEVIKHLAEFVSRLWQIHIFEEGNTRTTAVFFIKYLRSMGFDITNDIFAENAWYFRNSLVRANYTDIKNEIYETTEYLEAFLRNLLLNESNKLQNRVMYISKLLTKVDIEDEKTEEIKTKVDIEDKNIAETKTKVDIQDNNAEEINAKVDIQENNAEEIRRKVDIQENNAEEIRRKVDIQNNNAEEIRRKVDIQNYNIDECKKEDIREKLLNYNNNIKEKTICHAIDLYLKYTDEQIFGRKSVEEVTKLAPSSASKLIKLLLDSNVIKSVDGHGKGKYCFK